MSNPCKIILLDDRAMIENAYGKDMVKTLLSKYRSPKYCFIRDTEKKYNGIQECNVKLS
jgi:hypothetical protein